MNFNVKINQFQKEEDQEMSPVFPVFDDVILPIIPGLFETEDVPLDVSGFLYLL